eukprot:SAG31_NODE_95_length_25901_cov_24.763700_7_plen_99_part_00
MGLIEKHGTNRESVTLQACAAACADDNFEHCVRLCRLLCGPAVCDRATTQPPPLDESEMTSRGPVRGSLVVAGMHSIFCHPPPPPPITNVFSCFCDPV